MALFSDFKNYIRPKEQREIFEQSNAQYLDILQSFITGFIRYKTELGILYKKLFIRVASRVAERLKTFGNFGIFGKSHCAETV